MPVDVRGSTEIDGKHAVAALVASAFAVKREAMHAPNRGGAKAAFARQVAMYLTHTRLGESYTACAAYFGRDRTTAAHACRAVEEKREDPNIDAMVDLLERAIDISPAVRPHR
jgi:chromosomal replication initiation ATPase DnaA